MASILLPELLGFSPQLFLDDIIGAANDEIFKCVEAMEPFLLRWAEERAKTKDVGEWDSVTEVEQGLVTFQTLLESHTDVAFDFFEIWSKRNIFAVPPDLPVVARHHAGLNLNENAEEEAELMAEIEELRRKIENQKRLRRMYKKAVRLSRIGLRRSEKRAKRLEYVSQLDPATYTTLPSLVLQHFDTVSSLPHLDVSSLSLVERSDASKRMWETGQSGYMNWAVGQLVAKSKEQDPNKSSSSTVVSNMVEYAKGVGEARVIKGVVKDLQKGKEKERSDEAEMDTS